MYNVVWGILNHINGWSSLFSKGKLNCNLIMMNGKFVWWVSGTMINLDGLTYSIYLLYYLFKPIPKLNYASVWNHLSYSKRRFGNWKNVQGVLGSIFCVKKYFAILDPRVVSLVRRVVLVPHIYSSLHALREMWHVTIYCRRWKHHDLFNTIMFSIRQFSMNVKTP